MRLRSVKSVANSRRTLELLRAIKPGDVYYVGAAAFATRFHMRR